MERVAHKAVLCLVSGAAVWLAACGGGGSGSGGGGGNQNPTTPTVTVTPASNGITAGQPLSVTVTVAGTSGQATPTGTVTLSGGSYTSAATALRGGIATITVPAGSLAMGSDTLKATYTPDAASSSTYADGSGTALVTVTVATPTVTVTPASLTIGTGQPLSVTVTVAGFSGGAVPTGSVTLTGANGGYSSGPTTLSGGRAAIIIPAGTLPVGSLKLTASYSPDAAGSSTYASASGSATITVTSEATPTVSVSPASQSLSTAQALNVTVKVSGTGATPTGSVVLSSGNYTSAATTLVSGSATITIPAYSLLFGSDTLSATYTPDAQSSATYNSASNSAAVSVARATPSVTVTPAFVNINTGQSLSVTVAVSGPGTGAPAATGTVSLSGGGYTSPSPVTLGAGAATITIAAGALTTGSDTLTASYTPDTAGSSLFNAATGTSAAVMVVTLSTVTVNQSSTIAPVTDQLLGLNLAVWYDNHTNASAVNAAFGLAGIKAVRWPGGSTSDTYHWQTNSACDNAYSNPNSTFSNFVADIVKPDSLDLALTANYGSNETCTGGGDPAEAAAWAAEALKEGYPASHITVGNEEYGTWEYDLHAKKNDPATYANSVIGTNGYYQLIKTASPTTKVGVVVDAQSIQATWDSTVLSTAKGAYDFVEFHFYPQNPGNEDDTYLIHTAPQDLTTGINTLKSEMATAGVTVPIYVGEMGSVSSAPGKQSWSITQGLFAGQTLGEMMNDGVVRATWWIGFGNCDEDSTGKALGNMSSSLYGWQTFGAYNVFSDGPSDGPCGVGSGVIGTMSPTARAFQLFSNVAVAGESALSTSVTGDATDIRAYAATHSGGTALFLFNLNESQSLPVALTLSKQSASSDVTVITYDKSIYDLTNAATPVWADPKNTDMGTQNLPMTLTLTPWSMNVVIIK